MNIEQSIPNVKLSAAEVSRNPVFDYTKHLIFINQSGFNLDWPKRFTAPLTPDGTEFSIMPLNYAHVEFRGTIKNHIGDFTGFRPTDPNQSYVVQVKGGSLKDGVSDSFYVAPHWMQRVSFEQALRFFVDARAITGTHPGAFGAAPWRDAPYYAYCVESLVHLYLSNPSYFQQLRVEMNWRRDLARALAPGAPYDAEMGEDSLKLLSRMQQEVDGPVGDQVPDIVQLIHWGVAWWYLKPISFDYANSETKQHPESVAMFAFFLYAHPWMQQYFTERFHRDVSDFAFANWEKAGLWNVQTEIGTFKGRAAPGWTILPNLMMYEVAKRENWPNANRFLAAAVAQAEWMIKSLDLKDPLVTKGQRMSEHKSMHGLVFLLRNYREHSPVGVADFIRRWADIAISRSGNLWDYRRYDMDKHWSLPHVMPGHTDGGLWNDPGNLAAFPALAWEAASALGDAPADQARKMRLHEIAVAQWDILFGRNPLGCHSAWRGGLDWIGVKRGWPVKYQAVCGYLETVRGALCSAPATEHFSFNPAGEFRHPEGWTAFNSAYNVALAESTRREINMSLAKDRLTVRGPFFVPVITVEIVDGLGRVAPLTLDATDCTRVTFAGEVNDTLPMTVKYGHGYFATQKTFPAIVDR